MIDKMLRENNGWKDVAINWIVMITILCPLGVVAMLGYLWISLHISSGVVHRRLGLRRPSHVSGPQRLLGAWPAFGGGPLATQRSLNNTQRT